MQVHIAETTEGTVLTLKTSQFTASAIAKMRPALEEIVAAAERDIFIDLSEVAMINSSAIGFLAFTFKRLREKEKELVLVGVDGQPKQLLDWLRLDRVITMRNCLPAPERVPSSAAATGRTA